MISRTALQMDWIHSYEGVNILRSFLNANTNERRTFGFLEKPMLNVDAEEISFKIFLYGKAGIGKTDTVALLTGFETQPVYNETESITVTVTYWPAKVIGSKIVVFRLEFWDVGDLAIKKFSHMLPSCEEEANAVMYIFSCTDRKSFEEIPNLLSKVPKSSVSPFCCAVGTRFDNCLSTDVTLKEISEFEDRFKIPVIKVRNNFNAAYQSKHFQKVKLMESMHILNTLCNYLWNYHQVGENSRKV